MFEEQKNEITREEKLAPGLYLIATPIGNLEDMTLRAARYLKLCDRILAEDTRHSGVLLKHLGIKKPLLSFHDHNEERRIEEVLQFIADGEAVALISDAGMPTISDPGFRLVRTLGMKGVPVVGIPGPTAAILALAVSGIPTDRFIFEGFLPRKSGRVRKILEALKEDRRTAVFYESPKRLDKTLNILHEVLGNRKVAICRELTKKYEEVIRSDLETLINSETHKVWKGEISLVLEGAPEIKKVKKKWGVF